MLIAVKQSFITYGKSLRPLSFVSAKVAAGNTLTISSGDHQAGDLIVGVALRNSSTTPPSLPSSQNWTDHDSISVTSWGGIRFFYKISRGGTESFGSATNAQAVYCLIYRGGKALGATAGTGGTFSSNHTIPALTLDVTDGTSWVGGCVFTTAGTPTAATGMTLRANDVEIAASDTNAGVSSWSASTGSSGSFSSYLSCSFEILQET